MKFEELNLKPFLKTALKEANFYELTPIQELVYHKWQANSNIICQSATGSGKTLAFLLPILNQIEEEKKEVQTVIISPTRELASQLFDVTNQLIKKTQIDARLYIGGNDAQDELRRLELSQPQIVIGTLGRIFDLAKTKNALKVYLASNIVIDEADMVMDEKSVEEVDQVLALMNNLPRFWLFSATFTKAIRVFINKYLGQVDEITIEEENLTKQSIEHLFIPTKAKDKKTVLLDLINIINPYLALIFVNRLEDVSTISNYLSEQGIKVGIIHGDLDARERKQVLKRIKDNQYQYVVASDIASRGMDIEGVSHVINFDLPKDIDYYVHRTGRTARFNQTGVAYSLYDYDDEKYVDELRKKGLIIKFVKIASGELVPTKLAKKPNNQKRQDDISAIHAKYPKPKKVKPGYKKKRMEKITKEIKKMDRERIEEIYRRKNKNKNRVSR